MMAAVTVAKSIGLSIMAANLRRPRACSETKGLSPSFSEGESMSDEEEHVFVISQIVMLFSPMCSTKSKSDFLNASIRGHSNLFSRCGEYRRVLPDELLQAQRPSPR